MKKEYIFCNYHEKESENKNKLLKNIFKKNNIVIDGNKDIYAYLINRSIVKIHINKETEEKKNKEQNFYLLDRRLPSKRITEGNIILFKNVNIQNSNKQKNLNNADKNILELAMKLSKKRNNKISEADVESLDINILKESKYFAYYVKNFFRQLEEMRDKIMSKDLDMLLTDISNFFRPLEKSRYEMMGKVDRSLKRSTFIIEKMFNSNQSLSNKIKENNLEFNMSFKIYMYDISKNINILMKPLYKSFYDSITRRSNEEHNILVKNYLQEKMESIKQLKKILEDKFKNSQLNFLVRDKKFIALFFYDFIWSNDKFDVNRKEPIEMIFVGDYNNNLTKYYDTESWKEEYDDWEEYKNEEKRIIQKERIMEELKIAESTYQLLIKIGINPTKIKISDNKTYTYDDKTLSLALKRTLLKSRNNKQKILNVQQLQKNLGLSAKHNVENVNDKTWVKT
jgi:hypothetical protein